MSLSLGRATREVPTLAAPASSTPPLAPSRARFTLGVALATAAGAAALVIAVRAAFATTPSACGDACATAFSQSPYAVVLGVPALLWAAALHAVLLATHWAGVLAPRRRAWLGSAQVALVLALLGGSAAYLVIGLATGVRCRVCLALHVLALVVAIGTVLLPRAADPPRVAQRIAVAALAVAAWSGLAWGLSALRGRAAVDSDAGPWLAAVCEPGRCPSAARFGPEVLPDEDHALVLADGPRTLVAYLDLECAACRADFAAEEPLFRALIKGGDGLRLVLRASSRACDASASGGDPRACEAPAALVCAARHAGAGKALDLLAWELAAAPGYYTLADRRQTLAALSPMAARCFDAELALGPRGTLGAHAEAARRLATAASVHAGCNIAEPAWWCFASTPSFAIVEPRSLPALGGDDTFATATGPLRAEVLERCMEVEP